MVTEFKCEQCGACVNGTIYYDEHSEVERHYECSHCGYRRHWAYGQIMPDDSNYVNTLSDKEVTIN